MAIVYNGRMLRLKHVLLIFSLLALPVLLTGTAMAATQTITREIQVSAVVPDRRDVVVDLTGNIVRITSNTPSDVLPSVYLLENAPENAVPLTPELYEQYRRLVPEGTAKYGVLYERTARLASAPDLLPVSALLVRPV